MFTLIFNGFSDALFPRREPYKKRCVFDFQRGHAVKMPEMRRILLAKFQNFFAHEFIVSISKYS